MWWKVLLIVLVLILILCCIFYKQLRMLYVGLTRKKRIQRNLYLACKRENYLIINDILIQVNEGKFRHADTVIFGDKYIYVVTQLLLLGKLDGFREDEKWRLYYKNKMDHVYNPFKENEKRIIRIANALQLSLDNFKSIVAVAKTVEIGKIALEGKNEFLCKEDEVVSSIKLIEKNAPVKAYDIEEVEKYAWMLYEHGLSSEKQIKRSNKK